jgi:hypothetical protein
MDFAATINRLDQNGRLIAGGGAALVLLFVVGLVVTPSYFAFDGEDLIVLLTGIAALVLVFAGSSMPRSDSWPIPRGDLLVAVGAIATFNGAHTALYWLIDLVIFGGYDATEFIGLVIIVLSAIAALAVLYGALGQRLPTAAIRTSFANGDRGTKVAIGAFAASMLLLVVLYIVGWGFGDQDAYQTALLLTAVLFLMGVVLGRPWRLPLPASIIAVVPAVIGGLIVTQWLDWFSDLEGVPFFEDVLLPILLVLLQLVVVAGVIWSAVEHYRPGMLGATDGPGTPADPTPAGGDGAPPA